MARFHQGVMFLLLTAFVRSSCSRYCMVEALKLKLKTPSVAPQEKTQSSHTHHTHTNSISSRDPQLQLHHHNNNNQSHQNQKSNSISNQINNNIKHLQIENYKKGTWLILNIHITHHGGTFLCTYMKSVAPAPEFACIDHVSNYRVQLQFSDNNDNPTVNRIRNDIDVIRSQILGIREKYGYHMVSWEYGPWSFWGTPYWIPKPQWQLSLSLSQPQQPQPSRIDLTHTVDWENENLVSMIVLRHPLERFMAGGRVDPWTKDKNVCGRGENFYTNLDKTEWSKAIGKSDPEPGNPANQAAFWALAHSNCADNYAFRILAQHNVNQQFGVCNQRPFLVEGKSRDYCLEAAKSLLKRFTFVIDQSCLEESLDKVGRILKWHSNIKSVQKKQTQQTYEQSMQRLVHHHQKSVEERIANKTLYEFLKKQFKLDIELYEWSKSISVLKCNVSDSSGYSG